MAFHHLAAHGIHRPLATRLQVMVRHPAMVRRARAITARALRQAIRRMVRHQVIHHGARHQATRHHLDIMGEAHPCLHRMMTGREMIEIHFLHLLLRMARPVTTMARQHMEREAREAHLAILMMVHLAGEEKMAHLAMEREARLATTMARLATTTREALPATTTREALLATMTTVPMAREVLLAITTAMAREDRLVITTRAAHLAITMTHRLASERAAASTILMGLTAASVLMAF